MTLGKLAMIFFEEKSSKRTVFHTYELFVVDTDGKTQDNKYANDRNTQTLCDEIDGVQYILGMTDSHGVPVVNAASSNRKKQHGARH